MAATTPAKKKTTSTPKKSPAVTVEDEVTTTPDDAPVKLTVQGIEVEVPQDALNDFELMVHVMAVDMGDTHSIVHADQGLKLLLGLEQHAAVMAALRAKHGRVTIEGGLEFFVELIKAVLPNS